MDGQESHDARIARKNRMDILEESRKRPRTLHSPVSAQPTQKTKRHVNDTDGPTYSQASKRHISNVQIMDGIITPTQLFNDNALDTASSGLCNSPNKSVLGRAHHEKENFSSIMLTCDTMQPTSSLGHSSRTRDALSEVDTNIFPLGVGTTLVPLNSATPDSPVESGITQQGTVTISRGPARNLALNNTKNRVPNRRRPPASNGNRRNPLLAYYNIGFASQCEYCGALFWYDERARRHFDTQQPKYSACCRAG
ncbi:hypothetical protein PIB30_050630 [Stylosanthes scabra]|uniref:Uncharacterized protein n=1 Tax=Stylosanthes scabra TaxID=79078 RepID=A0ABU6SHJ4_9FABA|nr:hypothetical protein [Stylosanthes scabra]